MKHRMKLVRSKPFRKIIFYILPKVLKTIFAIAFGIMAILVMYMEPDWALSLAQLIAVVGVIVAILIIWDGDDE